MEPCPYLSQINKSLLDFDFEKTCSISLSRVNVYACLVCGKFFQGRSEGSHAFLHSIEREHFVWLNLHTNKFYCLPDDYEIDAANNDVLCDIKNLLKPNFDEKTINSLDSDNSSFLCVDGVSFYQPGIVGMIVLKQADYINAVIHALLFVKPLRNYFLTLNLSSVIKSSQKSPKHNEAVEVVYKFSELAKRIWSRHNFRSHVSVNEIVHSIGIISKNKYNIHAKNDPGKFVVWLVNLLDKVLCEVFNHHPTKKSIVKKTFQGVYKKFSRDYEFDRVIDTAKKKVKAADVYFDVKKTLFSVLPLTVPDPMIVKAGQSIIEQLNADYLPRVHISELFKKFDGLTETINLVSLTETESVSKAERYKIVTFPKYLIILLNRSNKQEFHASFTIVDFDLFKINVGDDNNYRLIANVVRNNNKKGDVKGVELDYSVQVLHEPSKKWFQIRDVNIREIMPESIVYSESCLMIWEKI